MARPDEVGDFWQAFCAARPDLADTDTSYSAWHFCDNPADADQLADLVAAGRKRATAGALWSYEAEDEPLPEVGDLSVITDWSGAPRCVIRTTEVEVVPFGEVTAEFAATEGEGDSSLGYWRAVHERAFTRELAELNRAFDPAMPVVCERFEVVFDIESRPGDGPRRG